MNSRMEIKHIKSSKEFTSVFEKLIIKKSTLSNAEKTFLLSLSIIILKEYNEDKRYKTYIEFAYFIILKYSIKFEDYKPLYDFSINFGFYPIAKALLDDKKIELNTIRDSLIDYQMRKKFTQEYVTETLEQRKIRKYVLEHDHSEVSIIAPTSFGKSSLIIEHIKIFHNKSSKVGIIVPTKSLLIQTYRNIRNVGFDMKLIIHDEMYDNEDSFISILTQERAIRLLEKNNLYFDVLYIDEAHKLFEYDSRTILLSRLIKMNKKRNINQKVVYLSPLISDSNNLKLEKDQNIIEQRIEFNIKEPEYYEYRLNGDIFLYNRFIDNFYMIENNNSYLSYIMNSGGLKNFIYLYSPKKIESFAKVLCETISNNVIDTEIEKTINSLKKYVHEDFYINDYLRKGIIYLHGKMPDNIKEYLEYKFSLLKNIRYVIANKVILEGINLSIDNLYILNTRNLKAKDMTNLIGRVNRLNQIFSPKQNNINKLIPPIYFINTREYNNKNSNMSKKIRELRSGFFKDEIKNPLLNVFDFEQFNPKKPEDLKRKLDCEKIIENEKIIYMDTISPIYFLKRKMLQLGMNSIFELSDELCGNLYSKISHVKQCKDEFDIIDKIYNIFIKDLEEDIIDEEFSRLKELKARNYYKVFLESSKKNSLKENISLQLSYFVNLKKEEHFKLYIGKSYGEIPYETYGQKVYVDLKTKDKKQLVNLAIIKLKLEDDFVSYKLTMFFQLMLDFDVISINEYNELVYGTTNPKKLQLIKMGLTINVINRLDKDNQLVNISVDSSNNIKGNKLFLQYKENVDDFFRFELDKFL